MERSNYTEKEDKKAGIAQSDIYQMVSYAIKIDVENILLLYPQGGINMNIDERK